MAKKRAAKKRASGNELFDVLRSTRQKFDARQIVKLFSSVSEERVGVLAGNLAAYISTNLPAAFEKRNGLADYRTNPYVLMTSASVMNLDDPERFGSFLFNSKLYMA